jgi:hypothetical protein
VNPKALRTLKLTSSIMVAEQMLYTQVAPVIVDFYELDVQHVMRLGCDVRPGAEKMLIIPSLLGHR